MKKNITLFLLGATPALFAAIDAGTYQNETLDALILNQTNADSDWVFENVEFTSTGDVNLATNYDVSYDINLKNTSADLSQLRIQRSQGSTTFNVQGSESDRAAVNITGGTWKTYVNASTASDSTAVNKLSLGGYADFSASTFCMASDAGFLSGTAMVDISGASNTFTITGATYLNRQNANEASKTTNVYFNISGVEGAKSAATFGGDFSLNAGGTGEIQVNMKGNAQMTVAGKFNLANDSNNNGKATFSITGENNEFIHNGGYFLLGADATGGIGEFIIEGKNNVVTVAGQTYIGTNKTSTSAAILKIKGTGHQINFNNNTFVMRNTSDANSSTLIFAADADGTSALNVKKIGGMCALEIDFTDFVGNETGIYEQTLIQAKTIGQTLLYALKE